MRPGWLIAAAAGAVVGIVAGCSTNTPAVAQQNPPVIYSWTHEDTGGNFWAETQIRLSDGWYVTCVIYDGYRAGGPSCDWTHPHREITR